MRDNRYSDKEYAYGKLPNDFLKEWISFLPKQARIRSLAEEEGRNAVFFS